MRSENDRFNLVVYLEEE